MFLGRQKRNPLETGRNEEDLFSTDNNDNVVNRKFTSVQNDQQSLEIKSSDKEVIILSKQKLHARDSILNTSLLDSTYLLKIQFKTQSYFKVTFLIDNTTDSDGVEGHTHDFQIMDVTVRGTCDETFGNQGNRNGHYYLDINAGNDFKTIPINDEASQIQTLVIIFRSGKFIHLQSGLVNHQIELQGKFNINNN